MLWAETLRDRVRRRVLEARDEVVEQLELQGVSLHSVCEDPGARQGSIWSLRLYSKAAQVAEIWVTVQDYPFEARIWVKTGEEEVRRV